MNFEGVGLSTDFVGGRQTQNFGSEVEIGVVGTIDVVGGISLVVGWEVCRPWDY